MNYYPVLIIADKDRVHDYIIQQRAPDTTATSFTKVLWVPLPHRKSPVGSALFSRAATWLTYSHKISAPDFRRYKKTQKKNREFICIF